ncbi:primosome assembly protein PriA, partial [Streptomyces rimosus subsp. rimosus]
PPSPGGRREGGKLVNGFVVERVAESEFRGVLAPIAQVLSPERVLTPELLGLCRAVADRYAGTLADVVQLAVPPRRAKVEGKDSGAPLPPNAMPDVGSWGRYAAGPGFLGALGRGGAPRGGWAAVPGGRRARGLVRATGPVM